MAEVLSQQEIDALLNNIKTGGEQSSSAPQEKEAVPYDFRLPNRISKIQLRTLRNIHENFAESLSSFLMTKLQSIININVISVDQIYYSEYVLSVSNPACLFLFDVKGSDIKAILELSTELAFTLIDRFLGGNGKGTKQAKVITPIEQKVLMVFIEKVMIELRKAWQIIATYEFEADRFESDIDFAQITSQSESVLIISFEIFVGEQAYLMNLCFATFAFDTLLSKLNSQNFSTIRPVKYEGTTAKNILINHLRNTDLGVRVEFGTASITMRDLLQLKKGDVVMMKKKIGESICVSVEEKKLFHGQPGSVNGHKAVKITGRVEPEN